MSMATKDTLQLHEPTRILRSTSSQAVVLMSSNARTIFQFGQPYSPQHRSQSHRDKHLSSNEDPCNDHSPAYYCTVEGFNMPRAFWSKLVLIEGYLIALDNLSYYLLEIFRHYPFWDMRFI